MASGGAVLSAFADFQLAQGRAQFTGQNFIQNELTRNGYTLPHFIDPGNPVKMMKMLQGGSDIRDQVMLSQTGAFESYLPNASFTYALNDGLAQWIANWRFSRGEMVYTDHEIGLNSGSMNMDALIHKFKDLLLSKRMQAITSFVHGLEDQMWAVPDTTKMEAAGGLEPFSLPVFINEFTNGLPSAVHPGGAWTTIQGLSPATFANWRCQQFNYDVIGPMGTGNNHLFTAFKEAFYKLNFHRLPYRPDLSNQRSTPHVIMCSLQGHSNYESALHQNQDTFVSDGRRSPHYETAGRDGYLNYRGIPMAYIPQLDTAAIYPTGVAGALSTEADTTGATGAAAAGPRYRWVNGESITKVFHSDRYFYQTPPIRPSAQPFTNVVVYDCWHQNVVNSLRSNGIVYPTTDISPA